MDDLKIAVVGGGIAGLSAARAVRLTGAEAGASVRISVFEASDRLGGKIYTGRVGDHLVEWGADSFLGIKPRGRELAEELGLGPQIVTPDPAAARTYVLLKKKLRPLPPGIGMGVPTGIAPYLGAIRNGLISPLAALRAGLEPLLPPRRAEDPTIGEVMRYRLGRRAADRLVAPLVEGIYGAPMEELSLSALLPQFAGRRSLLLAMLRRPTPPQGSPAAKPPPMFMTLSAGMVSIIEALRDSLSDEAVRTGAPVRAIEPDGKRYRVSTDDSIEDFDGIILATPSFVSAKLLNAFAPDAAGPLAEIRYHPSVVFQLRYARGSLGVPWDGSGYLVAPEERRIVQACSWTDQKWPHLRERDHWLRAVVSAPEGTALPDDILTEHVVEEVAEALAASSGPQEAALRRWPSATPIYEPGHAQRIAAVEAALPPTVAVAGAPFRGSGVADCIASGEVAARNLIQVLGH